MKYIEPKLNSFECSHKNFCGTGTAAVSATWGQCQDGSTDNGDCLSNGGAPLGSCATGYEAGTSTPTDCSTGVSANDTCKTNGNSVGTSQSVCQTGSKADL